MHLRWGLCRSVMLQWLYGSSLGLRSCVRVCAQVRQYATWTPVSVSTRFRCRAEIRLRTFLVNRPSVANEGVFAIGALAATPGARQVRRPKAARLGRHTRTLLRRNLHPIFPWMAGEPFSQTAVFETLPVQRPTPM